MFSHLINIVTMRLISTFRLLHFLDHVRVKTETKRVFVVDQRLENEVQTFFNDFKFFNVVAFLKKAAMRQHGDSKGQDVVR